jgi:hypothetical protein
VPVLRRCAKRACVSGNCTPRHHSEGALEILGAARRPARHFLHATAGRHHADRCFGQADGTRRRGRYAGAVHQHFASAGHGHSARHCDGRHARMTQGEHRLLVVVEEAIERRGIAGYCGTQFVAEIGAVSKVLLTFSDDHHREARLGQSDGTVIRIEYGARDGRTFAVE